MRTDLESLRGHLARRHQIIKRSAYLLTVHFGPVVDQYFDAFAEWQGGKFNYRYLYREHFEVIGGKPRMISRPCTEARALIARILRARGI